MKNRLVKGLIIFFSIVLVFIILFLVAITITEKQIVDQIEESENMRISDIDIQLLGATVIVKELYVQQQDLKVQAQEVVIAFSLNELIDLVFNKEKELSQVNISLIDTHIISGDVDVVFSSLRVGGQGKVSLKNIRDAHLYSLDVASGPFIYTQLGDAFSFKGEKGDLLFVGEVNFDTQIDTLSSFVKVLDIANIDITKPEFILTPGQKSSVPLLNAQSDWLQSDDNFMGERMKVNLSSDKEILKGEGLVIDFPIITMTGKFSFAIRGAFSTNLKITHIEQTIVAEVNPILGFFGYQIPKEPFTLDIDYSMGERPLMIEMNSL